MIIILVPKFIKRLQVILIGLLAFALFEFLVGGFIGCVAVALFTEPWSWIELIAIPVGALGWWMLSYSRRQLFSSDSVDPEDLNPIGGRGFFGWFGFLTLVSSLIAGFIVAGMLTLDNYRLHQQAEQPIQRLTPFGNNSNSVSNKQLAPQFHLRAIFYAPPRSSAVIDGQTVLVGDRIGDCYIKDIGPRSVTIQDAKGQTNLLPLIR